MAGDKPKANGVEPVENGTNGTEDVEMGDTGADKSQTNGIKEGEDEMTVVVPLPNSSKLSAPPADKEGDIAMGDTQLDDTSDAVEVVDPKVKAVSGE
jgi:26S proteasome regulatory subunit N3